ncbi:MAG: response regulator transcription factor [Caldisericia bacterium]|nr:response regulator transcription factor [Caldisericia bacterium]
MNKILIVDDERELARIIKIYLESEGFIVKIAYDGEEALMLVDDTFHLILLDVAMPGIGGLETCRRIRKLYEMPIIFLTAKTEEEDMINGLTSGADDYITKPFTLPALTSRVYASIRRYRNTFDKKANRVFKTEYFVFNHVNKRIVVDNKVIQLTRSEYDMLYYLASNMNKVLSLKELYEKVWNEPYDCKFSNKVMVYINRLRLKIEKYPKDPIFLRNVWGKGYTFEEKRLKM